MYDAVTKAINDVAPIDTSFIVPKNMYKNPPTNDEYSPYCETEFSFYYRTYTLWPRIIEPTDLKGHFRAKIGKIIVRRRTVEGQ